MPSGAALDGNGREQAHMGIAIGDYDNDGRDDMHITNFADDFNVLYHNDGRRELQRRQLPRRRGAGVDSVPRLGHGLPRLRQRRLARSARRQRARLPAGRSHGLEHVLRAARAAVPEPRGRRFEDVGAAAGAGLTTPRVVARLRGRRFRQRRRSRHRRSTTSTQRRRSRRTTAPAAGHWLTVRLRRRSGAQVPARRDRIGRVRHRRRQAHARRGRQRPRADFAVRPARALRPGRGDGSDRARSALGERSDGALPPAGDDSIVTIDQSKSTPLR